MPFSTWPAALLAVSIVTSLTVEGIKKTLEPKKLKYQNLVVVAVTIVLSTAVWAYYIMKTDSDVSETVILELLCFILMNFIVATTGYDKLMQSWEQIRKGL